MTNTEARTAHELRTNALAIMVMLRKATIEARERTGDDSIGTESNEDGTVNVVRVTYRERAAFGDVDIIAGNLTPDEAVAQLATIA